MTESVENLAERLRGVFGDTLLDTKVAGGEVTVEVSRGDMSTVLAALRDQSEFSFDQLIDVCAVDYAAYGQGEWITERATGSGFSRGVEGSASARMGLTGIYGVHEITSNTGRRFAVVYHLLSVARNQRLRVKVYAEDDNFPVVDSVVPVWACANWFEREAFDLYGVIFEGHPDLRRILSDYGFVGHPFRKDYPLIGNVEVRYDEEKGRVVYQPVSIEPRVLVPRVVRDDARYSDRATGQNEDAADA